jgi:hypothetical protein
VSGLEIDTENMAAVGERLRAAAEDFARRLTEFQAELAAVGPAFGDDETGSILGTSYEIAAEFVFESMTEALEEIGFAGVDLTASAAAHKANEEAGAAAFQAIEQRLGGV